MGRSRKPLWSFGPPRVRIPPSPLMLVVLFFIVILESAAFLSASLLHFGVQVFGYHELGIISEAIIQGIIGVALSASAYGIWKRAAWGRQTALVTHIVALVGAILGFVVQENQINLYNLLRLAAMFAALILLFSPKIRMVFESPQTP